jgi:hypothetical protein
VVYDCMDGAEAEEVILCLRLRSQKIFAPGMLCLGKDVEATCASKIVLSN